MPLIPLNLIELKLNFIELKIAKIGLPQKRNNLTLVHRWMRSSSQKKEKYAAIRQVGSPCWI